MKNAKIPHFLNTSKI